MTDEEKARLLDWMLTPKSSGRPDRPDRIAVEISKNSLSMLLSFRAWCSPEEALAALQAEMNRVPAHDAPQEPPTPDAAP